MTCARTLARLGLPDDPQKSGIRNLQERTRPSGALFRRGRVLQVPPCPGHASLLLFLVVVSIPYILHSSLRGVAMASVVSMASVVGRRWLTSLRFKEHLAPRLFQLVRFGSNTPVDAYPGSDSESNDYDSRPTTPWVRTVVSGVDLLRNAKYALG